ncbi:sodium-translocating pyrophosphatase [bacterium K02(2017)]|nr:sodium-translocating pyrophosphatase [bacterium K02(2017)]
MNAVMIYAVPGAALLSLFFAFIKSININKQDGGTERMIRIGGYIQEGAMAFLKSEYKILSIFVVAVAILLAFANQGSTTSHSLVALSFVVGAFCSGLAGYFGMKVATNANYRTANAARVGLPGALKIAFNGGSVMGLVVVGLGVLGLSVLFFAYQRVFTDINMVLAVLSGFSLGASSIALFARVGGGIYTKAADVGADLVGKVEAGIPEDHSLNPATIADNVGDNVGDVAGMGADLFESYVGAIIGSMVIGAAFIGIPEIGLKAVLLPLLIASAGIIISILGTYMVHVKEGGNPQHALNIGEFGSSAILVCVIYAIIHFYLPTSWTFTGVSGVAMLYTSNSVFAAVAIGLFAGLGIGIVTEYYCGTGKGPVTMIARQSVTGSATNIIAGLGTGMASTGIPTLILATAIIGAHYFAGLYGIALAALGMLANTGVQLAVDAYGPISDNAGGIAEMSNLPKEVRERTDKLDAVGNTTAAIGKGFAIGSAALTALALFAAFMQVAGISVINISNPIVMAGLFVGAMLPFVFSAMSMDAVGKAAMDMIKEVRRQFHDIPRLKAALDVFRKYDGDESKITGADKEIFDAGDGAAEYGKCVAISTQAALRKMIMPGLLAIFTPVLVGFIFGAAPLGGVLAGVTVSGVMLALFQSNAGGAWDNAKKMIESGITVDGKTYGKGSEAHKASVVGDTVGDPFKDTAGPSLNILIKLMSVVSLVIAPLII